MCLYKKASKPKYAWYIGGLMASQVIMAHLLLTEYNCKIWEIFTFSIYFVATQKVSLLSQYRMSLCSWLTCEIYGLFSCGFTDIKNFGFSAPLARFGGLARFEDIVYIHLKQILVLGDWGSLFCCTWWLLCLESRHSFCICFCDPLPPESCFGWAASFFLYTTTTNCWPVLCNIKCAGF